MVEQKERTRITQSGKNCAMNCTIQGRTVAFQKPKRLSFYEISSVTESSTLLLLLLLIVSNRSLC